jgi:hypothetical protein
VISEVSGVNAFSPHPKKSLRHPDNKSGSMTMKSRTTNNLLMKNICMVAKKLPHLAPFVNHQHPSPLYIVVMLNLINRLYFLFLLS